jgi:pyruvate ferredoxin oxidoreductase alpha subunit
VKIKTSALAAGRTPGSHQACPHIIVPEFNVIGWLAREIKATIPRPERVIAGPRVCGGMTMPPEIIVEEIKKAIGVRSEVLAGRGG